ncbi:MAG: Uma2 family endonuclease [Desulfamplus sp.]|nr:Uma2 family endonuclease [Desulfamplus sp.]
MGGHALEKNQMTPDEYLQFERCSEIRHEYFNGEIFAMTGGSLNHNRISRNIVRLLGNELKGSPCENFAGDMRVKIKENGKYTYPDIVVACGNMELENINGVETLLNPMVIMEILSKSTEAYDRGEKFRHFRLIPSLQEYILVSQNCCMIEKYGRGDSGIWQIFNPFTDMDRIVIIDSINCELLMSEIYYRVEFEA